MYAIKEGLAKINDVLVETFEREVTDGRTTLRVEAGTTGYKGAPCREAGGRTYVCIDCFSGDFYFSPVTDDENRVVGIEIAAWTMRTGWSESRSLPAATTRLTRS